MQIGSLLEVIKHYWLVLTGVCLIVITAGSLAPLPALPAFPSSDKSMHLLAYACLALPIAVRRAKYWPFLLLGCLGWSGAIELIQPWVNRYAEWLDFLANAIGLLVGTLFAGFLSRRRAR